MLSCLSYTQSKHLNWIARFLSKPSSPLPHQWRNCAVSRLGCLLMLGRERLRQRHETLHFRRLLHQSLHRFSSTFPSSLPGILCSSARYSSLVSRVYFWWVCHSSLCSFLTTLFSAYFSSSPNSTHGFLVNLHSRVTCSVDPLQGHRVPPWPGKELQSSRKASKRLRVKINRFPILPPHPFMSPKHKFFFHPVTPWSVLPGVQSTGWLTFSSRLFSAIWKNLFPLII